MQQTINNQENALQTLHQASNDLATSIAPPSINIFQNIISWINGHMGTTTIIMGVGVVGVIGVVLLYS